MTNRPMERNSGSLAIREMQIRDTPTYPVNDSHKNDRQ